MSYTREFIDDLIDVVALREEAIDDENYGQLEMPSDNYEPEPEDFEDDA